MTCNSVELILDSVRMMHWAFLCKGLLFPTSRLTACGIGIVSYLHTNLRVANNFERCERAFHQCQVWVTWQLFIVSWCCQSFGSTASHLPARLHQQLFLPLHSMPAPVCRAVVLYYCTFQGTVLWDYKCFILCVCFLCIICLKSIINLLQYSTI